MLFTARLICVIPLVHSAAVRLVQFHASFKTIRRYRARFVVDLLLPRLNFAAVHVWLKTPRSVQFWHQKSAQYKSQRLNTCDSLNLWAIDVWDENRFEQLTSTKTALWPSCFSVHIEVPSIQADTDKWYLTKRIKSALFFVIPWLNNRAAWPVQSTPNPFPWCCDVTLMIWSIDAPSCQAARPWRARILIHDRKIQQKCIPFI